MRAAIVDGPGSLSVGDVPEPAVGNYESLCQLLYGATCTGTDSHIIAGKFPWISPLPTILGHESVGRVVAVGPKVRNLRVGDVVTRVGTPPIAKEGISITWGGFTEMGIARDHWAMCADGLPDEQWKRHRVNQIVPHGVDVKVAPMFTTWRETLSYLQRQGFRRGCSILVVGSGGNGLAFAVHAANLGASCVAMAGAARMEAAAKSKGRIDLYFDYRREDLAEAITTARPEGFDLVIDSVGAADSANRVVGCVAAGGTLAIYGINDYQQSAVNPALAGGKAFLLSYCGAYDEAETHQQVSEWVLQAKLDASLWYDMEHPYPLTAIAAAFGDLSERRLATPKALIAL